METNKLTVYGKNELKRIVKIEVENILPQLTQYINKRIDTQTGLSKKFNIKYKVNYKNSVIIPIDNGFAGLQNNILSVKYDKLVLFLRICLNGGEYEDHTYYCQYFDCEIEIGEVNNFILTKVFSLDEIVKNYGLNDIIDLEEEYRKITKYKKLEKQLSNLKCSIKINF